MSGNPLCIEPFESTDIPRLCSWIQTQEQLVQFAGPIFSFPLTPEQCASYLNDGKRNIFKVLEKATRRVVGHAEIYFVNENEVRLCRILLGEAKDRGKNWGTALTQLLLTTCFSTMPIKRVALNVYTFNQAAIRAYQKAGLSIEGLNLTSISVNGVEWESFRMCLTREDFEKKYLTT